MCGPTEIFEVEVKLMHNGVPLDNKGSQGAELPLSLTGQMTVVLVKATGSI